MTTEQQMQANLCCAKALKMMDKHFKTHTHTHKNVGCLPESLSVYQLLFEYAKNKLNI